MISFLKVALALVLALAGLTLGFSEWGEVVLIRPLGVEPVKETRIWIVDLPDGAFVRGGGDGWAESAVTAGSVALRRDGVWANYQVFDAPGRQARDRVNAAMRRKYGFSDRFIGWTSDFGMARAVRLEPLP
jgi:hypothetical protein